MKHSGVPPWPRILESRWLLSLSRVPQSSPDLTFGNSAGNAQSNRLAHPRLNGECLQPFTNLRPVGRAGRCPSRAHPLVGRRDRFEVLLAELHHQLPDAPPPLEEPPPLAARTYRRCCRRGCVTSGGPRLSNLSFDSQTGRVPRTARTIQISKHAPMNPAIR
jgi:hypothetical protein